MIETHHTAREVAEKLKLAPATVRVHSFCRAALELLDAYRLWSGGHSDEFGLLMAMGDWWVELGLVEAGR